MTTAQIVVLILAGSVIGFLLGVLHRSSRYARDLKKINGELDALFAGLKGVIEGANKIRDDSKRLREKLEQQSATAQNKFQTGAVRDDGEGT